VSDGRALIDFAKQIFAARELLELTRPDGSIMHASIGIGDTTLMLADTTGEDTPTTAWLHVYVDDVDATYQKALSLGATAVQPPSDKGDGDRRGGFLDTSGVTWWIATHLT
jgi:uncharacterized glyoxalase superfamily protein PhnB